jgi:RNA polymerase sigma-70 factor (ECF subfamily)
MEESIEEVRELLTRYRQGQTEALGELVQLYRRPLYAFILRMTEGRDDVDEIFQEVWLRAIKNMDRFDQRKLLSWLFRIAHNLVIDRGRKKKPDMSLQEEAGEGMTREDKVPSTGLAPDRQVGASELGGRIREAVEALPLLQREVFLMRTEAQLSFKEIAKIQKVSLNTALGRMHYATTRLRETLHMDFQDHMTSC